MKITNREKVYDGFFKMYELTVEQNGHSYTREQFDRGDAVAALVFDTEDQQYVLTKQFRIGSETELVEIVAGMVDTGEAPEVSIAREIEEEIGYHVNHIEHLYTFYSSPGGCTERVLLYYAEVSHQHAAGGGKEGEHENIEIVRYSPLEFDAEEFSDAKTIVAQLWMRLRKGIKK
ncbi:NUDIX hydrolase [Pontibacter qinzhouensis]|uniref:GDP-mannose pyrophosphatase n=1 Tax=Pontibacter qinzhouensis TaxID=2603253 RepID=A0A5C8K7L1_9BACT|nr:NUDIX hydrolase [Pontibacter qinzhouensis]TXK45797.1 NUDIX hydrolase [Pontibacter qinzhouensis]